MKIAWCTPYQQHSAIGKFSSLVVEALAARDNAITLVSCDKDQPTEHRRPPAGIELLHWSHFERAPAAANAYDLFVYNVGDHFEFHFGVLELMDRNPGVCIFHDFYLVNLFLGWCESGVKRPIANSIVSSLYGEKVAREFWDRIGHPDFQEWSASHTPMTGWIARKALAAVAHAPFYEECLSEWSAGPVRVIPLAYAAPAHAPRLQIQRENGRVRLLTVGMVNPNKRVEAVLRSVASSPLLRARCEYDIVGDIVVAEKVRLQSLIDQFGLQETVRLHGSASDFELRWRYAEADIVCCLRWPALEGASASCVEAMFQGKAVIVTDTGFYSSIPSDRVFKVRPAHEIQDLTEHLEMLALHSDTRDSLGQRAREWAEIEYAPANYAIKIEPLLEVAAGERPVTDALRQIGQTFRSMGVEPEAAIVERIGSEFLSLFFGRDGYTEPSKSISNLLREPESPAESKPPGEELPPPSENTFSSASVNSHSEAEEPGRELPPHSANGNSDNRLKFLSEGEQRDAELPPDSPKTPILVSVRQFVGRCTAAILRRARRYSLRHFLFRCAEPILSHLRGYFLGDLFELTRSVNQRIVASEQSLGALERQVEAISNRVETLASRGEVAIFADGIRKQIETLAPREEVAIFADNVRSQIETLAAREKLTIFADEIRIRTDALAERAARLELQSTASGPSSSSTNPEAVVIVGSGGHAKVVIELVRAEGKYLILGCTGLDKEGFVLGDVPILGTDTVLPALLTQGVKKAFVAIGNNRVRLRLLAQVSEMGFELINAVSPNAVVSPSASLGRGIAIMAGAIINASARIGDGAIINTHAGVDHDCSIGNGAHISPGSTLAGNVEVGCEAFLGVGTCVLPGSRIGNRATIGAGSVVLRDIPDDATAMGVPARTVAVSLTPYAQS